MSARTVSGLQATMQREPPPVPSAFQPPPLLSNPSSVESALTHVSLAAEPVHPYTTPALRPSGSVLVHPNTLTNGLALPGFRSPVNPFRVELIAPFFSILSSVLTT
ncbi:hypothetical protein PAXINDRAFT_21850 [Paxillus involutus ATCC 200175]|uniref:Uncharacterized protein n=1 Tax=Paxillus involutus ATCC 200175 TaxID=664439 RepID=A0A0C9SLR0_PAXIN|nr:hypothetical protein PAXINDRAFT_21850 [Paxillus involutus ATCC 200175]